MKFPTKIDWWNAAVDGFLSNGSTSSPDTVLGISIANGNNTYPPLPADLHDYRYYCGGTEEEREEADDEFLTGLYAHVACLPDMQREVARRRCRVYHKVVRTFGASHWNLKEA